MGDALIKQVTPKSGSNSLVAVFWGTTTGSSLSNLTSNTRYSYDEDYFSYSSYIFTALQDFNATVRVIGRGSIDSTGTQTTSNYVLYHNGSSIASGSMTNGSGTAGATVSVSFSAGDTISIKTKRSGSTSVSVSAGFYVEVA